MLGRDDVFLSVTSIDLVRGVLATAHAWVEPGLADKDLWRAYRAVYGAEPFVRIVHERGGIYRHPEPKLLAGTNLADVGWEMDPRPAVSWPWRLSITLAKAPRAARCSA